MGRKTDSNGNTWDLVYEDEIDWDTDDGSEFKALSPREKQVLKLLASG